MVDVAVVAAALGKGMLARLGSETAEHVVADSKDRRAFNKAVATAVERFATEHREVLTRFDVAPTFFEFEGAREISKVLLPGPGPDARALVDAYVRSLPGGASDDAHLGDRLEVPFEGLLEHLEEELGRHPPFRRALSEVATTRDAGAVLGADAQEYLLWVQDKFSHIQTAGIGAPRHVQLPLGDIFVTARAVAEPLPGEHWSSAGDAQHASLMERRKSGEIDAEQQEMLLDRLAIAETPADLTTVSDSFPVTEAVRDEEHIVVLGDPGAGKTTLLQYLAFQHARALRQGESSAGQEIGPARFPIYVRIGSFARSDARAQGLQAFIPHFLAGTLECPVPRLPKLIAQQLRAGRCLVLLDGLDEVTTASDRQQIVASIVNFVTSHHPRGNRFVCTSRIAGYLAAPLPETFAAVRVLEMDDGQIEQFLRYYAPAVIASEAPDRARSIVDAEAAAIVRDILDALATTPGVRRLASNPLLLTTLLLVHRSQGELPARRVDAYKAVTDALGHTWRAVQGVPRAELPDDRQLTQWLTRLGDWLHRYRSERAATARDLLEVLGPLWAQDHHTDWDPEVLDVSDVTSREEGRDIIDFVKQVNQHSGLLVEHAPGRWGFSHLTFEEFYAGRALAFDGRASRRPLRFRQRLHDPRYVEPILLGLGLIGRESPQEVEELFEAVLLARGPEADRLEIAPSSFEDLLGRDFLFALRALGDDIPVGSTLIDELLAQALDEWLDDAGRGHFHAYRIALAERLAGLASVMAGRRLRELVVERLEESGEERRTSRSLRAVDLAFVNGADPALLDVLICDMTDWDATLALVRHLPQDDLLPSVLADRLIDGLRAGPNSARRDAAECLAAATVDDDAYAALLKLVESPHTEPALFAAFVLVQYEDAVTAERRLLELALGSETPADILAAAILLGFELPGDLYRFGESAKNPGIVPQASPILNRRHPEAREPILERLADVLGDDRERVAFAAARLLKFAGPIPDPLLMRIHDEGVASSRPVSWWSDVLARQSLLPEPLVNALVSALANDPKASREVEMAKAVLPHCGRFPESAVALLSQIIDTDPDLSKCAFVARCLENADQLGATDAGRLSARILGGDSNTIIYAARVLAERTLLPKKLVAKLMDMVDVQHGENAIVAAEILMLEGHVEQELSEALSAVVHGPDTTLAVSAAETLMEIRPLTEEEETRLLAIDDDPVAASHAAAIVYAEPRSLDATEVRRLLTLDAPVFDDPIAETLGDPEYVSDAVFHEVLNTVLDGDAATESLSWNRLVRAIAKRTRSSTPNAMMLRAALLALRHAGADRWQACRVLRDGPADPEVIDALATVLRDGNDNVQGSAARALAELATRNEGARARVEELMLAVLASPEPKRGDHGQSSEDAYDVLWQIHQGAG